METKRKNYKVKDKANKSSAKINDLDLNMTIQQNKGSCSETQQKFRVINHENDNTL